jgi:DNA-binding XRE family transcriptional regulator
VASKFLPSTKQDAGYFMRQFRAKQHLEQQEAAELIGISASHWCLLENGQRLASPPLAHMLAKMCSAPPRAFVGRKKWERWVKRKRV